MIILRMGDGIQNDDYRDPERFDGHFPVSIPAGGSFLPGGGNRLLLFSLNGYALNHVYAGC